MLNLLNSMLENTESELKKSVLESLIDKAEGLENEEIISMINDIVSYGCASGIVSDMMFYRDTESFFNTHSEEIFDLMNEKRDEGWDLNNIEFSKNNLAWWAYEVITSQILYEL